MSDEDESYLSAMADLIIEEETSNLEKRLWVDNTGKKWKIKDMGTSYLEYCLKKIIRDEWRLDYKELIEKELKKRKLKREDGK